MPCIRNLNRVSALAALAFMAAAAPAAAQRVVPTRVLPVPVVPPPYVLVPEIAEDEIADGEIVRDRLSLVVGAAVANDYEGSNDYTIGPVAGAAWRVRGHSIVWQGNSLGVDLVPERHGATFKFIAAPFISLNLNRMSTPKDPVVALLPEIGIAAEGGMVLGFTQTGILTSEYDSLTLQLSGAHDLGSVHKSFIVTPSVIYTAPLSQFVMLSAAAGFDVVGAGYARRYFGIDEDASAASGLPYYRPDGGLKSASVSLDGVVSLSGDLRKGLALGTRLNYQRLLGGFADSPIVDMRGNPNQFSAALGLAYIF